MFRTRMLSSVQVWAVFPQAKHFGVSAPLSLVCMNQATSSAARARMKQAPLDTWWNRAERRYNRRICLGWMRVKQRKEGWDFRAP